MTKNNQSLGSIIKSQRLSHLFTQEELACKMGITRQAFSLYERDINIPTTDTLIRLAEIFQISPMIFLTHVRQRKEDNSMHKKAPFTLNLTEFHEFYSIPDNLKKYHSLSGIEKELLFFFQKLDLEDRQEILLLTYLKATLL